MLNIKLLLLHPRVIVLLSFWILPTTLYRRSLFLLRIILMGCLLPLHMMILIDIICMCLMLLPEIITREKLYVHLSMFPIWQNCKKLFILCIGLYYVCMNCSFMTCRCIGRELDFVISFFVLTTKLQIIVNLNWLWYTLGSEWIHYLSTICLA